MDSQARDSPEGLPLEDPRWLPSREVLVRLHPHLGGKHVAESDITTALREGNLGCRIRYRTAAGIWERRLVSFLCWATSDWSEDDVVRVAPRRMQWEQSLACLLPRERRRIGFSQPGLGQRGSVLYFWRSDLARLWPAVFPASVSASTPPFLESAPLLESAPFLESAPKNPRGAGAKQEFDREFILIEAAAYVVANDLPSSLEKLVDELQSMLGDKMAGDTQGKNILRPFFRRVKQALGRR